MALSKTPTYSSDTSEELMPAAEEGDLTVNTQNIAHILSRLTEMYPNPILASVRETVSNALDATMKIPEADRKPVEVSVGMFDDTFTVRDYGVGMSLEEVKENFLRYGSSTKTGDFEAVGAFGLGAKAPLSYTSEFTVTTTQDGVTTAFKLSNTAAGFKFAIMYSRNTGRENGTIVAIPMVDSDRRDFMEAVSIYQKYSFDLPVIVNGEDPTSHRFAVLGSILLDADTKTYGRVWLDLARPRAYSRLPTMIDGNADYGFVLSGYFYENPSRYGGNRFRYRGSNASIVIELKPGVVDFTSSRDDIAEGPRIQAVRDRIQEALDSPAFLKTAIPSVEENLESREFAEWLRRMRPENRAIAAEVSGEVGLFNKLMDTQRTTADNNSYITSWNFFRTKNPVLNSWGVETLAREIPGEWNNVRKSSSFLEHVSRYMGPHYTVVTGITKDNVAKFLRSRARFVRSLDCQEGAIVALNKPIDSKLEGYVGRISTVVNYTIDEFIAKAASVNPPSRDKTQPKSLEEITVDAVSTSPDTRTMQVTVSAKDLIDNSEIVVLHRESGSYENVHAYFENRGEVAANKPIYIVPNMTALMLKAIVDTSAKVHVHSSAKLTTQRSKYVEEFVKNATEVNSEERTAYLRSVSDKELAGFVIRKKVSYYSLDDSAIKVFELITGVKAKSDQDSSPYNRRRLPSDEVVLDEFISRAPEEKQVRIRHLLDNFPALQLLASENNGKDLTGVIDSIAALAD